MAAIEDKKQLELGEAIERILIECDLSVTDFSRKIGFSRQYVYNLMKGEAQGVSHKIQLDTLKAICDATGYSMVTLLSDLGYISPPTADIPPNTVLVVKKNEQRAVYSLTEEDAALVEKTIKALKGDRTRNG